MISAANDAIGEAAMQGTRDRRFAPVVVTGAMLAQVVTHLAWLPVSAQVGQLAMPYLMSRGMTLYGSLIENHPPSPRSSPR